jgi:hypothetical protein
VAEAVVAAIAEIGAAIGGTSGAFMIMNAQAIASGALLLGTAALASSAQRKAKAQARAQFNAAQVDRLVNVQSTVAPRELVLGRVRKGGTVFFKASTDANNTKFVMCIALAGHEIDAVETIYLNDVPVTLDGSGYVTSEPYQVTQRVSASETFTGNTHTLAHTPVDDASGAIVVGIGDSTEQISFTRAGAGLTVSSAYEGQTKTVHYQWADTASKVRVTSYLGTAGQTADATLVADFPALWSSAHRARGVAYLVVECWYDENAFPSGLPNVTAVVRGAKCYDPRTGTTVWTENPALMVRHVLTHAAFGKRTSITADEDTRISAAANACDTSTVYTVAGVAQPARALYKAALVVPFGSPARDVLDDLAQAMAGMWAYAAGQLYLKAGAWTASVKTLTDADLAVVQRGPDGAASQSGITITTHRARDQLFNTVTATIWDTAQDYKQTALTPLTSSALVTRDGATLAQAVTMPAVGYAPQALHVAGIMLRDARDPLTVVLPFKLTAYPVELFDTVSLTLSRFGWTAKTFVVLAREFDGTHVKLTLKETAASIYTLDASFSAQGGADNTNLPDAWDVPDVAGLTVTSGQAESVRQPDGSWTSQARVSWTTPTHAGVLYGGSIEVQWRAADSTDDWRSASTGGADESLVITGTRSGVHYIFRARYRTASAVGVWCAQVVHQAWGVGAPLATWADHADGWPGTKTWCTAIGSPPYLEATNSTTWSALTTWDAFGAWNYGFSSTVGYDTPVRDLGALINGAAITIERVTVRSMVTVQVRASSVSEADVASQPWASNVDVFTGRWFQVRLSLTAYAGNVPPVIESLGYSVRGRTRTQQISDLAPASLPAANRITAGDFVLPTNGEYSRITAIAVAIRDTRHGVWSWSLIDKTASGPRVQVRLDGALTDPAYIDASITGV